MRRSGLFFYSFACIIENIIPAAYCMAISMQQSLRSRNLVKVKENYHEIM